MGDLMSYLLDARRREAGRQQYRAVAICATGYATQPETGEQARAMIVNLEDWPGEAQTVAIPFSKGLYGSVVYHDRIVQPGRRMVLVPEPDDEP